MPVNVYKISDKYYGPKNIYKLQTWYYIIIAIVLLIGFIYFFKIYMAQRKHRQECIKCKYNEYCQIKYSEKEVSVWTLLGIVFFLLIAIFGIYSELNPSSEYILNRRYVYRKTR